MLCLIQRVTQASVTVDDAVVGQIGPGLLALVGVEPGDDEAMLSRMADRLLGYRVFADDAGKMNRSLRDTGGGLLLSASSPWPLIPVQACARASPAPRRRPRLNGFSTDWWLSAVKNTAQGWKLAALVPIWLSA